MRCVPASAVVFALLLVGSLGPPEPDASDVPWGQRPLEMAGASSALVIHDSTRLDFAPGQVVRAADASPGADRRGAGGVLAGHGAAGADLIIHAPVIIVGPGVEFIAGSGGRGGNATALGDPDALAVAGDGGRGGRVFLIGEVVGNPIIRNGKGGDGGHAFAIGLPGNSCSGAAGTEAAHRGANASTGPGGNADANGTAGACGGPGQPGGAGGNATAHGGNGGVSSDGNGGAGGNAVAHGGRGGDGGSLCLSTRGEVASAAASGRKAGDGGAGGGAFAYGGDGGMGVNGGAGGRASITSAGGHGGAGSWAPETKIFGWNWANHVVQSGTGGTILPGEVLGGAGADGVVNGGPGGSAAGELFTGDGGSPCRLDVHMGAMLARVGMPALLVAAVVAGGVAVAWRRR